jgi:hypothetical protein
MPEIEDYIEDATHHERIGEWKKFAKDLKDDLKLDRRHWVEFIRELRAAAKGAIPEDIQEGYYSLRTFSNQLADFFRIDNRQFQISDLPRAREAVPQFGRKEDAENKLIYLRGAVELESDEAIPDGSIQTLIDVFERRISETTSKVEPPLSKPKGLVREMGIRQAVSTAERENIYTYWEKVGTIKYDNFVKAMEELLKNNHAELSEVKEIWNEGKGDESDENVTMQKWNYVLIVDDDSKYATVPLKIRRVMKWVELFLKKIGVEEKDEERPITGYTPMAEGKETGPAVGEIDLEDLVQGAEKLVSSGGTTELEVDPILRDLINRNEQKTPFTSEEWKRAKNRIRIIVKRMKTKKGSKVLTQQDLDYVDSLLDRFGEQVGEINLEEYYLPINPNIFDPNKVREIDKQHYELLEAVNDALMDEVKRFETPGYGQSTGLSAIAGKFSGKEEYTALLLAIQEYYSEPILSDLFYDRNNKPRFSTPAFFAQLASTPISAFSTKLDMALSQGDFEPSDLENVAELFGLMKRGAELNFSMDRMVIITQGQISLRNIIGDWEENKQLAGHMIYVIAKESWENVPDKFKTYKGKSIEDWHDDYVSSTNKNQPISLVGLVLNSSTFKTKLKIKPLEQMRAAAVGPEAKPIIDLKHTEVHESQRELLASAQQVLGAIEEMHTPLMEVRNSLDLIMYAHDMIRKMLGKRVIYEYRSLTNIDDIDYILKQVPKYDLTAIEIQTIVNDIDSFNNIAKSVGVDEETVYTIKALCRGM